MRKVLLILAMVGAVAPAAAQGGDPAKATGFRADLIAKLNDAEHKIVALATAFPKDKFVWRPAGGGRSVSETLMHVVMSNLNVPSIAGVPAAGNVRVPPGGDTTIVDKARIIDYVTKSFLHARESVMAVPDAKLDAKVTLFGAASTRRGVIEALPGLAAADLAILAGYAKTNGISWE